MVIIDIVVFVGDIVIIVIVIVIVCILFLLLLLFVMFCKRMPHGECTIANALLWKYIGDCTIVAAK